MLPKSFRPNAFWRHVRKDPGGCWIWTRPLDDSGYGRLRVGSKVWYAHVLSYELETGAVPEGHVVDHTCRNRACVRPDHLEAVTGYVNTLRGAGPSAQNARKTHCKKGHEFTEDNIIWKGDRRNCKTCRKASREAQRRKVKASPRRAPPTEGALRRLRAAGETWAAIGVVYGVSDTTARKWGRQKGVK